jgi:hypothetical protein
VEPAADRSAIRDIPLNSPSVTMADPRQYRHPQPQTCSSKWHWVKTAARVVEKLGHQVSEKVVYKFIWAGANVERWADTARETGRSRGKYFSWLCGRELAGRG